MYKRILIAVDGSQTSARALQEAIRVARGGGGALQVVHVVNELVVGREYAPAIYYETAVASMREAGEKVLQQAGAAIRKTGVEFETKLVETIGGRAADDIVRLARDWPADLIVMGTHGRRGLSRLVMGSDAELVVRSSPVPVLIVRGEPESP
jgi:nucleotide-binding universal stress UspA family protein